MYGLVEWRLLPKVKPSGSRTFHPVGLVDGEGGHRESRQRCHAPLSPHPFHWPPGHMSPPRSDQNWKVGLMVSQEDKETGTLVSSPSTLCPWNLSLFSSVCYQDSVVDNWAMSFIVGLSQETLVPVAKCQLLSALFLFTESSGNYLLRSSLVLHFSRVISEIALCFILMF